MPDNNSDPAAASPTGGDTSKVATPKPKKRPPNKKPAADGAPAEGAGRPRSNSKNKRKPRSPHASPHASPQLKPAAPPVDGAGPEALPKPKKRPPKKKPAPADGQPTEQGEPSSPEAAVSPKKKKAPKKKAAGAAAESAVDGAEGETAMPTPKKKNKKKQQPSATKADDAADPNADDDAEPLSAEEAAAQKIMKQVEFYFSEENLPSDKFLLKKLDGDQTVTLDTIMSFKRIKKLSADADTVRSAINQSAIVHVCADGNRVGRIEPLELEASHEEVNDRTVIAQNLPADASIDSLTELFSKVGLVRVVRVKHPGQEHDLNFQVNVRGGGSFAVIEYDTPDLATRAAEQLTEKNNWRNGLLVTRVTKMSPAKKVKPEKKLQIPSGFDSAEPVNFEEGALEEGIITAVKDSFAFATPCVPEAASEAEAAEGDCAACGYYKQKDSGFEAAASAKKSKGKGKVKPPYTVFVHQGNLSKSQTDEIETICKELPVARSYTSKYSSKGKGGGKGKTSQLWSLMTVGAKVSYILSRNPDQQGPVGKDVKLLALSPDYVMPRARSNSYEPPVSTGGERPRRLMLTKKNAEPGLGTPEIVISGEGKQSVGPLRDGDGQYACSNKGFEGPFKRSNIERGIKPKPEPEPEAEEDGAIGEDDEGVRGSSTHVDLKNLKDSGSGDLTAEEFAALRAKTKTAKDVAKNMTPEQQAAYGCKPGVAASAVREDSDDSDDEGADFGNMGGEGAGALLGDY